MPVTQDPFGPSVYMPDPNQVNAASASQGWATGISNLGRALFPDPSIIQEARLRGAQTQQALTQTQTLQNQQQARTTLQGILGGDPNAMADPNTRAAYSNAIIQLPPEEQQQARANFGLLLQNTNLPQDVKDHYTSGAGVTNYTQTPTGVNDELQNRINTATIGANATVKAAGLQAGAMVTAERIRDAGETYRQTQNPVIAVGPQGPYQTTAGKSTTQNLPVLPPNASAQDYANFITARNQGNAPLPGPVSTPSPSHGTPPDQSATQPQNTTALPANANGNPTGGGNFGQTWLTTINKTQATTVPKDEMTLEIARYANQQLGTTTADPLGIVGGTPYQPGPGIIQAVSQRATQLYRQQTNPGTYQDMKGAVAQAWREVVEPYVNDPSRMNWQHRSMNMTGLPPTVDYQPGFDPFNPKQAGPLPTTTPTTTPTQTAVPPSGRSALPQPAANASSSMFAPRPAAAATPTTAAPTRPAAASTGPTPASAAAVPNQRATPTVTSPAQIPPGMRKAGVLVVHGNLYTGGPANQAAAWRAATPAEIATARQQGYLIP